MDAGQLGEEHGQARMRDRRRREVVGLLQGEHGVADERDRQQEQDRGAGDQHRPQRQLLAQLEDRVGDPGEGDRRSDRAEHHPQDQPLGEQRERLVEEHRLEALAEYRREPETGECRRRARGHRARHARAHELDPPAVLEARHEPEAHADQHHDRDQCGHRLEQLPAQGRDIDDERREHEQDGGGDECRPDAQRQRPLVVRRRAGRERPEQDRDQQDRLDALPEEDREREAERHQRRRHALLRQLAVDVDERRADDRRVGADPADGRAVADVVAQLRVLELRVDHQVRVAQAQRDLDELEVVEVGGARERVRLVAVPGLQRVERPAEDHPRLVDLLLGALGRDGGAERGRGDGEQCDDGEKGGESAAHRETARGSAALIRQP